MNVAVFHRSNDVAVRKSLDELRRRGFTPTHVYNAHGSANPQLPDAEAIIYITDHPSHTGALKIRKIAEKTNKPLFSLPRKTATWDRLLEPLGMGVKKLPPANDDARIALVPPPPPSNPEPVAATEIPPPPPSSTTSLLGPDQVAWNELVERENAELRAQVDNLSKAYGQATTRAMRAETMNKALPVFAMPSQPKNWKEVLEALRVLVLYGQMDGLQALDLLANGPVT